MTAYRVKELENPQSHCDGYNTIEASCLSDAKRKASKTQMFQGTVLELSDECGVVAWKIDNRWEGKGEES